MTYLAKQENWSQSLIYDYADFHDRSGLQQACFSLMLVQCADGFSPVDSEQLQWADMIEGTEKQKWEDEAVKLQEKVLLQFKQTKVIQDDPSVNG